MSDDPRSTKPRLGVHRDPDLPSKPSAGIPRTPPPPADVTEPAD